MTTVIDINLDTPVTKKQMNVAATGVAIVVLIFVSPLGIADLAYGFKEEECLREYPHDLHLNMRSYLLVSGFLNILTCLYIITSVWYITDTKDMPVWLMVLNIILTVSSQTFYLIWNIMGSIVFWSFLYPERHCSSSVSNYLFASLIIKLVFTYMSVMKSVNKKED